MHKQTKLSGFTIVELLIVVVVIAILAAISVVAYTNMQGRAHDSVVQSDLTNFARKIRLTSVETDVFPRGGSVAPFYDSTLLPGFNFEASKSSYMATADDFIYCEGVQSIDSQRVFRILGQSKSGNRFAYRSDSGIQNLGTGVMNRNILCAGLDSGYTWAYGHRSSGWSGWVGAN